MKKKKYLYDIFNRNVHYSITATLIPILLSLASAAVFVGIAAAVFFISKKLKSSALEEKEKSQKAEKAVKDINKNDPKDEKEKNEENEKDKQKDGKTPSPPSLNNLNDLIKNINMQKT